MTFLHLFASLEACIILFLLWVAVWYADRLDTERRRNRGWHDECCYLRGRPMSLCGGQKGDPDA